MTVGYIEDTRWTVLKRKMGRYLYRVLENVLSYRLRSGLCTRSPFLPIRPWTRHVTSCMFYISGRSVPDLVPVRTFENDFGSTTTRVKTSTPVWRLADARDRFKKYSRRPFWRRSQRNRPNNVMWRFVSQNSWFFFLCNTISYANS